MSAEPRFAATPRRRAEARREGRVARSGLLTTSAILAAAGLTVVGGGAEVIARLSAYTEQSVTTAFSAPDLPSAVSAGFSLVGELLGPVLLVAFGVGLLIGYVQVGALFTVRPLMPDPRRVGVRRPGNALAWWDAARGLVVAVAALIALRLSAPDLLRVSRETLPAAIEVVLETMVGALSGVLVVLVFLGVVDWLLVRVRYERSLRMTWREVEDERSATEADPLVKARLRVFADRSSSSASTEGAERDAATGVGAAAGEVQSRDR